MLQVSEIPLALYVHIPWCVRKCPYCDFNSHAVIGQPDQAGYVNALLADLDHDLPQVNGRPLTSVFFGGGTPSLFSPESIEYILNGVCERLHFDVDAEITLEANPGASDERRFRGFRQAGINRLSIGVQSFSAASLRALGRIHGPAQAREAVAAARQAGFGNINLDLMFGLPGQTMEQALNDLRQAIDLEPEHLSWYQLTIEPNTLFHARPPVLPADDLLWDMQQAGKDLLQQAGYDQYEVSAYAKETGRQCRHNLNYWQFGDYLGIGAGAHGKVTQNSGISARQWKQKHPAAYMKAAGTAAAVSGNQAIVKEDLPVEFMMNAMRLTDGVTQVLFEQRTGLPVEGISNLLRQAQDKGLLNMENKRMQPTALGQQFLNDLLGMFEPG